MRRLVIAVLIAAIPCVAQTASTKAHSQGNLAAGTATNEGKIVLPAGTIVPLALTRPVFARSVKPGDSIYAQTVIPVVFNNHIVISVGTYVEGQIDSVVRPGWLSPHAHFLIHYTKIIFVDGYTVQLPNISGTSNAKPAVQNASQVPPTPLIRPGDVFAAVSNTYVEVSSANDVFLDNGTQIEMLLQLPLRLNAANVAEAVRRSNPAPLPQFASATQCRPTSGTPGTSDTVISGTPGTSGTPDIVIPGANGTPDIVVPGIPATPGTPDTVIPGMPGTPATVCPGPPVIVPDAKAQKYKESFQIASPVQVSGKKLPAGNYQVTWQGLGPTAVANFLQNGKPVISAQAMVILLNAKSPAGRPETRANPDGSVNLKSIRFAGESFALYFSNAIS
jgi:hypothetical protein